MHPLIHARQAAFTLYAPVEHYAAHSCPREDPHGVRRKRAHLASLGHPIVGDISAAARGTPRKSSQRALPPCRDTHVSSSYDRSDDENFSPPEDFAAVLTRLGSAVAMALSRRQEKHTPFRKWQEHIKPQFSFTLAQGSHKLWTLLGSSTKPHQDCGQSYIQRR
jgi:hypothetical protein